MKTLSIFPTALFVDTNEMIADDLLIVTKEILGDERFTINRGYKTTFGNPNGGLEKLDEFKSFSEYITNVGKQFFISQGYSLKKDLTSFIFANEMYSGDAHPKHAHPESIISGVFYLNVPNESSPIVFFDPRPFRKFLSFEEAHLTEFSQKTINISPHKGLMLMWESWLEHCVPKNNNETEPRISLVFNLYMRT